MDKWIISVEQLKEWKETIEGEDLEILKTLKAIVEQIEDILEQCESNRN